MRSFDVIPVSLIKEYAYCPRYAYNLVFLSRRLYVTDSMDIGREDALDLRRVIAEDVCKGMNVLFEYELIDEGLRVRGRPDAICIDGVRGLVCEVKALSGISKRSLFSRHRHFLAQGVAYAVLAERTLRIRVDELVFVNRNDVLRLNVLPSLKEWALRIIEELRVMLELGVPPRPIRSRKCGYCVFNDVCWPLK